MRKASTRDVTEVRGRSTKRHRFSSSPKVILGSGLLLSLGLGVGCSSNKAEETVAPSTVNEFSSLPEVTGPVTSSSSLGFKLDLFKGNSGLAATTGVLLGAPGEFGSGTSRAMCENVNLLKETLREAAGPDKILCYMGAMRNAGVIPATLDIADGEDKYIQLANLADSSGSSAPRVKFKIVKAADGSVESFKMYSCFSGTADAPQQSEYISQSFSGTNATVVTKNLGSEGSASYGSSLTTTGVYDSGWVSKNMNGFRYYSAGAGETHVTTINLDQYADAIEMGIAMKGGFGGATFENRFFTVAQILGSDLLSTFALGDGSTKAIMSFTPGSSCPSCSSHSYTGVASWNGDDKTRLIPASSGDLYAEANAGTVPSSPDESLVVSFSGDEAWDCNAPSGESFVQADFASGGTAIVAGMAACEEKFLGNNEWLQCFNSTDDDAP